MPNKANNESRIDECTAETKKKICAITDKSIKYFHEKLEEEICSSIESYKHENFQEFVEGTVTKSVKKNFESWVTIYTPAVEKLLLMPEKELARRLSYNFKQKVNISTKRTSRFNLGNFTVNFSAEDVSDVNLKAGAAAAGSFGLMAIAGAVILPLIGFVAEPYLKKKFLKNRLERAKSNTIPKVKNTLLELTLKMQDEIHGYIDDRCVMIVKNTKFAYEKILNDMCTMMKKEIEEKKSADFDARQATENIQRNIDEINSFRTKF